MEVRKAKLLIVLGFFSNRPHCQEFETNPKRTKYMGIRKAKLLIVLCFFSNRPHCQEFETNPKQNNKWKSEKQNYSLFYVSFRTDHIAKSSKRIRNNNIKGNQKSKTTHCFMFLFEPITLPRVRNECETKQ